MSGSGVRQPELCNAAGLLMLTRPSGKRGRLRDAAVAGSDEEQAQGRPDRPRPAEAKE